MADKRTAKEIFTDWNNRAHDWATFGILASEEPCIKSKVISIYKAEYQGKSKDVKEREGLIGKKISQLQSKAAKIQYDNRKETLENFDSNEPNNVRAAAHWIWRKKGREWVQSNILQPCADSKAASSQLTNPTTSKDTDNTRPTGNMVNPFDKRLIRLEQSVSKSDQSQYIPFVPFGSDFAELTTTAYLISKETLLKSKSTDAKDKNAVDVDGMMKKVQDEYNKMSNNEFYKGVPSLQNYYSLTRLYGSNGGRYLINQKGQRRWYELDSTADSAYNFASTPTTSAIISWGQGDPYGRTPYQFSDFVFSKYWKKIENNRLITLRRFAAPILDNMKFPGMSGEAGVQNSGSDISVDDSGKTKDDSQVFPPMSTAITYFGNETGNSLNSILKFTTGVLWDDVQAGVWEVNTESVPSNESGIGGIFKSISKFAEMLNVAGGNFDRELVMNNGQLPPDPYRDGPYENRIMGPVNRIDSVKKRKPGLAFEWGGLDLVFEYVARPIGGISPKAALLDIMSNFLVMGSASAVFFGGAHRFMANPAKYPFLGGQEGIEKWYKGDPIGWSQTAIKQFTQGGSRPSAGGSATSAAEGLFKNMEGFFNQLFSGDKGNIFGSITSLFTGATGKLINNEIAKKTAGQVPYLHGMKAILTGEPVGEWHVTIGNPLNPIAMIGNLICEGITVEFNEELGPDDFPTEMKVTVKLKHAMARDRDAIESIFNRGMGRIYNLPDSFSGSADFQTKVDNATQTATPVGYAPNRRLGIMYKPGLDSGYIPKSQAKGTNMSNNGSVSVWNRQSFDLGISENSSQQFIAGENDIFRSSYRAANWVAQRSLT